jgi:hypothetical protein
VTYSFIESFRPMAQLKTMCRVLKVSMSGFLAWRNRPRSQHDERDLFLVEKISACHAASRETYGAPRIHADLLDMRESETGSPPDGRNGYSRCFGKKSYPDHHYKS